MSAQVVRCLALPDGFNDLHKAAIQEGFSFLDRLAARWRDGRYLDDHHAALFAQFDADAAISIGAHTADDYEPHAALRRMRHVYVHPGYRRLGHGRALAGALIQDAIQLSPLLTVNATHSMSRAFWESLGFVPVSHPTRSHEFGRSP